MFSLFSSPKLEFEPVDPLGDGLGDDIEAMRSNPEVVAFQQDIDGQALTEFWNRVEQDIHRE